MAFPGKHLSALPWRFPILIMLWAFLAVSMRNLAPWFFWLTMFALPGISILHTERRWLRTPSASKILLLTIALLAVHVGWAVYRAAHYDPMGDTYWRDDQNYIREAAAIARAWMAGNYPDISLKGASPYLGTLHTGYHRPLSALFTLFGASTLAGLLLNSFCAAAMPMLCAIAARYLWIEDLDSTRQHTSIRTDVPLAAGIMAALHPNQFYWASYLLKDTYTAFVFMYAFVLILGACKRKNIALAVASLFALPYLFSVRAYTALALLAGLACVPLLKLKRRVVLQWSLVGLATLVILLAYTQRGNALYSQLQDSLLALAPKGMHNPLQLITFTLSGVPRLFLSPYGWLYYDKFTPMMGLYPGMWYLYLIILPLGFAGIHFAVAKNLRFAVIPLAVIGLSALLFLSSSYGGAATRQRFYLEYLFVVFAALGLRHPNKWWIGAILIAELAFAIGQVLALR